MPDKTAAGLGGAGLAAGGLEFGGMSPSDAASSHVRSPGMTPVWASGGAVAAGTTPAYGAFSPAQTGGAHLFLSCLIFGKGLL